MIKSYIKMLLGCIIGIIIVDIILALIGLVLTLGLIFGIIKTTMSLIFHPIKFFKSLKTEKKTSFKDLLGIDWKDFVDIEKKKKEDGKTLNPFVDMLNEELEKLKKKRTQIQKNGDYTKNNVQIGNITIKGE